MRNENSYRITVQLGSTLVKNIFYVSILVGTIQGRPLEDMFRETSHCHLHFTSHN
ncbi:hypothetical protein Glove_174g182 [Diversispora epigaea]|uniref:Uncharacterized protein n=1 Tax=Diversispora epigaea TaxID=1348612 RepID=A0A397INS9_9GLOM|nr:hypothetical protein Glove_174g182 [Diversispora epigaea]